METPTPPLFADNDPLPEMVTRRKLINGKYVKVSTLKLAPGEKYEDPFVGLLRIREAILREQEAEQQQREAAENSSSQQQRAA